MICSKKYQSKPAKYSNGYVTIFFTIALSLILSLLIGLLYSVRENAFRMKAVSAMDTAMTSTFAEYNKELWKQYELIFVDSSYMTKAYGMKLAEDHLKEFINSNFDEVRLGLMGGKDLLKLDCSETETLGVCLSTDKDYAEIRKQIVNLMKNHYKITYTEEVLEWVNTIEEYGLSGGASYDEAFEASGVLKDRHGIDYSKWLPSLTGGNSLSEDYICSWGLLARVTNITKVSTTQIKKSECVSQRPLNEGNLEPKFKEGLTDDFFYREYAINKFGNYKNVKETSVLDYQVEYIVSGKYSDSDNLSSVVRRLMVIREAANMITLYSSGKLDTLRSICKGICGLFGAPEAAELLVSVAAACWANFESIIDVKILLKGGRIPLIKTSGQWITNAWTALFGQVDAGDYDEGLSYEDYLRIFIYLTGEKKIVSRMCDLIEMDIRSTARNEYFRLDNCFDDWMIQSYISSKFGYDYTLIRRRGVLN